MHPLTHPPSPSPWSKELDQDNWIARDGVFKGISRQIEHVTLQSLFFIRVAGGDQTTQY